MIQSSIIQAAKRLYQANMLASADGNISYKLHEKCIYITPAAKPKAFICEEDIATITLENEVLSGNPSSERLMHLAVYRACPQAKVVVHAHPPTAIAWSIAFPEMRYLPDTCLSELILACGSLPIVPYARPGTLDMGTVLLPYLPQHRAMILARHGALAWGETLDEAVGGLERIEHTALILYRAKQLAGLSYLPEEEVAFLRKTREKIGEKLL